MIHQYGYFNDSKVLNLNLKQKKRTFSVLEDATLLNLVSIYGIGRWKDIANLIPGRTERQCRERYKTYLAPGIRNDPWTQEEDNLLVQKVNEIGPKWAEIAKFFNGRTDNSVKNRYNIHIAHRPHPRKRKAELERLNNLNQENNQIYPTELTTNHLDFSFDYLSFPDSEDPFLFSKL